MGCFFLIPFDHVEIDFEAKNFRSDQFSIGFSLGWQVFKDRLEGTFSEEGRDVTGTQVRYVNTLLN